MEEKNLADNKLEDLDKEIAQEEQELANDDTEIRDADEAIAKDDDILANEEELELDLGDEDDISIDGEAQDLADEAKEVTEEKKAPQEVPEQNYEEDELMAELGAPEEDEPVAPAPEAEAAKEEIPKKEFGEFDTLIFGLRTTANREDQVMDFLTTNAEKKNYAVYSIIRAHGMRGYIFVEAETRADAEAAAQGVPYARGLLPKEIEYREIEHMLEQVKRDVNMKQNDIVEIISGPFKRENAKIIRLDKGKEEVVVGLLEAAVPIPITLKLDAVKVIRREEGEDAE